MVLWYTVTPHISHHRRPSSVSDGESLCCNAVEAVHGRKPPLIREIKQRCRRDGVAKVPARLRETRWTSDLGGLGRASVESGHDEEKEVVDRQYDCGSTMHFKTPFAFYSSQPMRVWDPRTFEATQNVRAGFGIQDSTFKCKPGAGPLPLCRLLSQFRPTETSDLRAKVYAFLGISEEFSVPVIP